MPESTATTRVVIVTGASGGIGRAVAERLALDGMAIVAHYSGNAAKADETVAAITTAGGRAISVGGDVADETAMSALFETATEHFGLDVVVHTAGIMPLAPIAEMDLETSDRIQRVNVRGTFVVDHIASLSPMERLCSPDDTAEVTAFLAGPGRWVNGQTIYANGGTA